ncbi:MAG: Stp1/IreP family PP2C-type Ser/Thr phosphatase [Planctomycetota bacterium]|jgi:protein phosphatase
MGEPVCKIVTLSDVGKKRRHNEDFVMSDEELGVCVVADGMGGHMHGEVASRLACETVFDHYRTRVEKVDPTHPNIAEEIDFLRFAVEKANHVVYRTGDEDDDFNDMGTTAVCLTLRGGQALIANVGDSRCYRWRNNRLRQLTRDHSWVGEMWEKKLITKESAMVHPERNVVTRALGVEPEVEVDTEKTSAKPGDIFLLCSDGLTDLVEDAALVDLMRDTLPDLNKTATALINIANERGGDDNISVALIEVGSI